MRSEGNALGEKIEGRSQTIGAVVWNCAEAEGLEEKSIVGREVRLQASSSRNQRHHRELLVAVSQVD